MISTSEAWQLVQEHTELLSAIKLPLGDAYNLVLAEDLYALYDIPAFPQSSMDGYAISFEGWKNNSILYINGEMAAGSAAKFQGQSTQAARIFTGAAVPEGYDTVVMQEKVERKQDQLYINDTNLVQGSNVRPKGSEIKSGSLARPVDSVLTPATMGFLAGIGISAVTVYPKPTIEIILTGNELQMPGTELSYGQVYESNSYTLTALLNQSGIYDIKLTSVRDDSKLVEDALQHALEHNDIVIVTGGVSVGDYDFVVSAAEKIGVKKVFHKVQQKPGRPFYFGKKEKKLLFGLPGNPASVLTCYYIYVHDAIQKLNHRKSFLQVIKAPIAKKYTKPPGLTHYLKGYFDGSTALPLLAQESYKMSSFAEANCLIKIEENVTGLLEGDTVDIYLLPF